MQPTEGPPVLERVSSEEIASGTKLDWDLALLDLSCLLFTPHCKVNSFTSK